MINKLVHQYIGGGDSQTNTESIFGKIKPPKALEGFKINGEIGHPGGMIILFNNILKLLIVGAGIFALINFILAGYSFMNAAGDAKKIELAWAKIWQSMAGLLIIASSFALAALIGKIMFGSATAILQPIIYGPGK